MMNLKKKLTLLLSTSLVISMAIGHVINYVGGKNVMAETLQVNETSDRNKNYVFQLPSDGLAEGTVKQYVTEWSGSNVAAMELPETSIIEQDVKSYLDKYIADTSIGRMMFNVNYSRSVIPSDYYDTVLYNVNTNQETGDLTDDTKTWIESCPTSFVGTQYYWYTLQKDIDLVEMGINYVSSQGVEAWASLRMNDNHAASDPNVNSHVKYNNAFGWGIAGNTMYLDYTKAEVQTYHLNYIKEICRNYDISGIELDFLRAAPYMAEVNEENIQSLTDFVRNVKTEIQKISAETGKDIKLSVRAYATEEINLGYGMDVASWVANGSVDLLTVANYYAPTSYDLPIQDWRTSIEGKSTGTHDYSVIAGLDWFITANPYYAMYITPAHVRGFVSAAYANGADGVYLFNMFDTEGEHVTEYFIDESGNCTSQELFSERLMASNSLVEAESGARRYVYNYYATYFENYATIPRTITGYSSTSFDVQTGTAPKGENGYYIIAIGLDDLVGYDKDNLIVTLNGKPITQISDMSGSSSLAYKEPKSGNQQEIKHITQTSKRMLQFAVTDLSIIKDGYNQINVLNSSTNAQKIVWLEVFAGNNVDANE